MNTIRRAGAFDVARLLFVGALWGMSFIFIALALPSYGPISIAAGRIGLAALVLFGVCAIAGNSLPRSVADWGKMTLIGFLNSALPFFLISWGMQFISSAEAALLLATGTFSSLLISHFVSADERINLPRLIGVSMGFCGVLILVITELMESGFGGIVGQLAVIGSGVCYAASSVLSRRVSHIKPMTATGCILATASAYMVPLALLIEQPFAVDPEPIALFAIIFLGVAATAFAYVIRLQIITLNGAVFMSQAGYLVPVFGVFWSWLFLSEQISARTLIALGIVLVGIAVTRRGS